MCARNEFEATGVRRRPVCDGAFVVVAGRRGPHVLGGIPPDEIPDCPSCGQAYVVLMTLDLEELRVGEAWAGRKYLPLFHCPRCRTFDSYLCYRCGANGIRVIDAEWGEDPQLATDWASEFPLGYPQRMGFGLLRFPTDVQSVLDKAIAGERLGEEDEQLVSRYTGHVVRTPEGSYPSFDVCNQVGGRAYLPQGYEPPMCPGPKCSHADMQFLACVTNDRWQGIKILLDGVYVEYWCCLRCGIVHAAGFAS